MGIAFIAGWCILYFHEIHVKCITLDEAELLSDGFLYSLDEEETNGDGTVSGWVLKSGTSVETCSINVVLKESESMKAYILPTQVVKREDVTLSVDDGNNYDYSGFEALTDTIDSNKEYTLCFRLEINDTVYYFNTQQTIAL